ncbi:MAG: hypothetical protein VKP62_03490 [Candidatus Sericytochromatia bacterium]|nr:hypothetical protein [Candidatus Sericytochromatia bacterium]
MSNQLPPRTLLGQFLQELAQQGLTSRQVESHLIFLRLWQAHVRPARLLEASPDLLASFVDRLKRTQARRAEIRFAEEAIENFYAFALDRQPRFPARDAWEKRFLTPPTRRVAPIWEALADRFAPALRRVSPEWVVWPAPPEGEP